MDEFSLTHGVADSFREYGFSAEVDASPVAIDGELILEKDGVHRVFPLEVKLPLTLNTIRQQTSPHDVLYVTDQVSARTAEVLRRMNIHFVDAAGNAFLATDGWYVDVRGRRRPDTAELQYVPLESEPNLYSARRAQVVFALLSWSDLLDSSVRTLADAAGVSVGIAQSTTKQLRRRGLWPDQEDARSVLIDGWAAAFPETLGRSLTIRSLRAEQFETFYGPVLASGESAPSAQMRATSGVVYVDELSTELLMLNRWRTDGPPNLIVRRCFWSHPSAVDHEAPPLLVYGDLQASGDPRVRSVANEYRYRL
ncbi:MAG: type IV toxin-antitoxin system AbiEi family antitoxin [Pseudolysinimonas sp.]